MNARYRVTNRLGLLVAGQRLNQGDEVSLTNEEARPLLAASAIERAASTPAPASASRTRRRAAAEKPAEG